MKRITPDVTLYKPHLDDLWFRQAMMADPETMSYNNAWGGTIPFPREKWEVWTKKLPGFSCWQLHALSVVLKHYRL